MHQDRITDPKSIDVTAITKSMAENDRTIVQFSEKCYSQKNLQDLNKLASEVSSDLEIRFFGHYSSGFDSRCLSSLPDAKALSIDCITQPIDIKPIRDLKSLQHFHIGVFELDEPDILEFENLHRLNSLIVGETRKKNIRLAHLASIKTLKSLILCSHHKNIETVSHLAHLECLYLNSIGKNTDIDFIEDCHALKKICVILGGRSSINFHSESVEEMEIIRVRGVETLGDISRFKSLRSLAVEDQIKINNISFSSEIPLEQLRVLNCKALAEINGLAKQKHLNHIRIARTSLSIDGLIQAGLPESLKTFAVYTGKEGENKMIRAMLESLGYDEHDTPISA